MAQLVGEKAQDKAPLATRENLLQLAARSFSNQGYAATSMRSIAEQAGIEVASIYYHFKSKEELIDVVMTHGAQVLVQQIKDHIAALPAKASAEERFRAAIMGQMSAILTFGDYALANVRLLGQLPEKVLSRHLERREEHQQLWNKLLADLRTEKVIRADLDLRLCRIFILGSINSVQVWFNPKFGSLEKVVDQLCSVFFEGTRAKG